MKWPQPEPSRAEADQFLSSVPQKQRGVINSDYHRGCPPSAAAQPPAGDSIFWVHLIIFTAVCGAAVRAGGCSLCSALEHVNNHYTCLNNSECSRAVHQPAPAAAAARRGMEIWTTPASSRPGTASHTAAATQTDNYQDVMLLKTP